jgi:uncharacterized protein (TIGR00730 family)
MPAMSQRASSAAPAHTRGVWGELASGDRGQLARTLVEELENGLRLLGSLPPAVTFFGGARVRKDDPYYAAAEHMGALLADRAIPPRTGAGPGIMSAVPEGYRRRLLEQGQASPDEGQGRDAQDASPDARGQLLTQGFNIRLPFEQVVNPAIDVSLELSHFPTRKLMLYENALGVVIFPGGFGTLDELFEIWRLKIAGRLSGPFVLFGRDFWSPLLDALQAIDPPIPAASLRMLHLTDDPVEAIAHVTGTGGPAGFGEPPAELGRRIAAELVEGLAFLENLPPAVTVLGGSRLSDGDPALRAGEALARLLAAAGVPTRAAGPGQLSVALARGGHAGAKYLPQQAFGMRREDARNLYGADRVHVVNDRLTHKVLLTEGSRAVVALPGGVGTLDELFSVICQLQTRKIAHRRVVLLGRAHWAPLFAALQSQMLDGPRQTISAADLGLVQLTDDPEEAARLCLSPPPALPPKTAR